MSKTFNIHIGRRFSFVAVKLTRHVRFTISRFHPRWRWQ